MKISFTQLYEKYMFFIGTLGHSIFLFQAIRILATKSSHDVSLTGFLMAFISTVSWLVYGYLKNDKILFYVNIFGTIAALSCIFVILYFRNT